jgi:hypothetical protein
VTPSATSATTTWRAGRSRPTPSAREIGGGPRWERIALTAEQVERYDLPKIIKRDRRYKDGRPHGAVETEAIKQTVLIGILRAWLEMRLPEPLARVQERQARQRRQIAPLLRRRK